MMNKKEKRVDKLIFNSMNGLIPAVIQDYIKNEVLMVGYLNQKAWEMTNQTGKMHYFSRKKQRIWMKGEQSKHFQFVKEVYLNCDNTCLLIKVKQIGGACDQGLKSCFDKRFMGKSFKEIGNKIFEPGRVYGKKFTQQIKLGIPCGSLEKMTIHLLELAYKNIIRPSQRSYHLKVMSDTNLDIIMVNSLELPILVEKGPLDAAIIGFDLITESNVSVRDVCDLGYNKLGRGIIPLALAIPKERNVSSLNCLNNQRIATPYPNITKSFFKNKNINVKIIPSLGATEGKVPFLTDAIVELVETGATLEANNLKPILKIFETTAHLIANNESWGYTWKRRRLEDISVKLKKVSLNLPKNLKQIIELPDRMP